MSTSNPVEKHQREVRFRIILPVLLPAVLLIVLLVLMAVGVAADVLVSKQITSAASLLFTIFIAIPLVLVCIVPYILLAFLAVFAGRFYAKGRTPIRFLRRTTEQISTQTQRHVPKLARPLIGLNVWLTRWEYRVRGAQNPVLPPGKDIIHE